MIVLGLVLVAGGVIVTQFLRSAVDYYCNVDEVGTRSGCDADRRLRLQGVVERGSVVSTGGDTSFDIAFNDEVISVYYSGEPGGIFKECMPVVVHGNFDPATDTFLGDRVEVKPLRRVRVGERRATRRGRRTRRRLRHGIRLTRCSPSARTVPSATPGSC